ncbi:MAG: cell division protein FtsL [Ruminococcus flavefaciens]|nr:cell division protein FtsL [Ruminococcus flavefaciens]MCM1229065.1 cell division protein FtsL [Ruminococcus flavefaciens]
MADNNSVRKLDDNYAEETAETSKPKKKQKNPKKKPDINVSNTETKSGSVFSIILVSALAVVMLGTVIYSFDRRNTMYSKVSSLNSELNLAEAENVRLQSELDSKMSAKNVEDYAENVLGMQKIDSSQIQYIEIQTDDVVNIPEQDESLLSKLKRFFDSCVEYFRG